MEDISFKFLFFACALFHFLVPSSTQTCKSYVFLNCNMYRSCNDLEALNSFLHWNYDQATSTVDIAYRHTHTSTLPPQRWVAWAINPTGKGMVGSQALVAYQNAAGILRAYTSQVTSYNTKLEEGGLIFQVSKISAEFSNNEMIIYAKFVLPMNVTMVNHVWQEGPVNHEDYSLCRHDLDGDHLRSMGVVDFLSGQVVSTKGGGRSHLLLKKVHGGINMLSWGILLPIGVLIARYTKDCATPAWFYAHLICQSSGYIVGLVGAAIGFSLGVKSHGIQYVAHKYIGVVLVVLGFLQVLALKLRPSEDHDLRQHWKMYHLGVGYLVIILSITNIFKGFYILKAMKIWMLTYIGFVVLVFILFVIFFNPILRCKKVTPASAAAPPAAAAAAAAPAIAAPAMASA